MDVKKGKVFVALIHGLHVGGAQKMMLSILNYFAKKNFEVHLIVFSAGGILQKELAQEVIVHELNSNSISKGMGKCLKLIYKLKPNFVFSGIGHLNLALAPFIPVLKLMLPKTHWIARETNIVSLQNKEAKYPKIFDWLYQYFYKNYDKIIAQSLDMKKDLEENYGLIARVQVINNPVNIEKVEALANSNEKILFNSQRINLLSVAGLRKEKCHDLMLKVIVLLDDKYHLHIVGSGELETKLLALAKSLGIEKRVSFLGYQSNPYAYMKQADLFLLTSQREGFPNVLLEANSLGLPIVAFSSLGGITEIIDEGVNGFTVPFERIEEMAQEIEKAHNFVFNKKRIQEMTKERYAYGSILKKYEQLFSSLEDEK